MCCLMFMVQLIHAINFHPLPASFTNTIRVSPSYGVIKFKSLDLSSIGGQVKDMNEIIGIGLKWGAPFDGWAFQYFTLGSSVVSQSGEDIRKTALALDAIQLRWYFSVINDGTGKMSLFSSVGQFSGNYQVSTQSESNGITQIKERLFSGVLVDVGVVFGYEFNPEWDVFLQALYQFSMDETLTNYVGEVSSDPVVDMTGAMIQLGSTLRL